MDYLADVENDHRRDPLRCQEFSGDLFAGKQAPIIDTNNGGSGIDYPDTLMKAASGIKGVETVIPGHSAVTDFNAFKEYGEFMREMVAVVQDARKQGKTAEQAAAELKLHEKFKDYGMTRLKDDVTKIFADLK